MERLTEFDAIVRRNEPLAPYTHLRLGGPAEMLVQPRSRDELSAVVRRCFEERIPLRVLGSGCNMLVRDEGVQGARLGIDDNATTGRFTGQRFGLDERLTGEAEAALEAFRDLAASGIRLMVVDLPSQLLLQIAGVGRRQYQPRIAGQRRQFLGTLVAAALYLAAVFVDLLYQLASFIRRRAGAEHRTGGQRRTTYHQ